MMPVDTSRSWQKEGRTGPGPRSRSSPESLNVYPCESTWYNKYSLMLKGLSFPFIYFMGPTLLTLLHAAIMLSRKALSLGIG